MKRLLFALLLVACAPAEPHWEVRCVESHTETNVVYWPSGGSAGGLSITPYGAGINTGGGMHMVNETVCDRYDSTWVVPDTTE